MKDKLWVDKYRPTTLDDYVFSDEKVRELCFSYVDNKVFPHLLLSGIQGTGKTTLARILINECGLNKIDIKTVNASSKTGIDNVRDGIETFCKTLPLGSFKVVLMEEADSLSVAAQKALRAIIEDSSDNVRFIFTCNYPNKIIEPIQSRLTNIHITELDHDSFVENIVNIIDKENVIVGNIDFIENHINSNYPDMRKTINSIQKSSVSGTLRDVWNQKSFGDIDDWIVAWKVGAHQQMKDKKETMMSIVSTINLDGSVDQVYRVMYENVNNLAEELRDNAISIIADHLYKSAFVADQEINLAACIVEIFDV